MFKHRVKMLIAAVAVWSVAAFGATTGVDYPTDYRSWQHLKSMVIKPGHPLEDPFGGIHHIYANPKAMTGLSSGDFETGAVFVFDLLDYVNANNMIVEASRKRIDVMQYDSTNFSKTGGWGYDTFVGDSTTQRWEQDVTTACFSCHEGAKTTNYVFSQFRP